MAPTRCLDQSEQALGVQVKVFRKQRLGAGALAQLCISWTALQGQRSDCAVRMSMCRLIGPAACLGQEKVQRQLPSSMLMRAAGTCCTGCVSQPECHALAWPRRRLETLTFWAMRSASS